MSIKRCVVLNPRAGRGLANRQRGTLIRELRKAGLSFDMVFTFEQGHAKRLTRQLLARGYTHIVAVGGDGTLHEVVNGMVAHTQEGGARATLGMVALGTGNDFIKSLDGMQANNVADAVQRLTAGRTRLIDVGMVTVTNAVRQWSTYFINDLGLGIHAHVAQRTHTMPTMQRWLVYTLATVQALVRYKAYPMSVSFENTHKQQRFLLLCAANGRCQGSGFWLAPTAQVDDGLLDVCLIDMLRLDEIIRHIPSALHGTHTRKRQVTMGRTSRVTIECTVPFLVSTDGEIIATDARHVEGTMLHQVLEIVV